MASTSCSPSAGAGPSITTPLASPAEESPAQQQLALLDMFFPGFSILSAAVQKYTHIDLNIYVPVLLLAGGSLFAWQYFSDYTWRKLDSYLMSRCSLRTDDEAYNYVMAWIAKQRFSLRSRRFIVNTNTDSRSWFTWKWRDEHEDDDEYEGDEATRKPLSYTPDFGSHYFFYKGRLLIFHRSQNRDQGYSVVTQKEEISISCFGRDPGILKELLIEARDLYLKRDEKKTSIYRGSTKAGSTEPTWQRCMARTTRPFSTVILNEKVKKDLIDDVTDYLDPATRRWYSNRGIPYRRGYLLHGPPGTGKSSLSLALAGFFKMRIYIVSLSSIHANEETLASLFAELPRRCVVLLEDIDSAGLTHTREDDKAEAPVVVAAASAGAEMVPGQVTPGRPVGPPLAGRLSLSGLLNILDGVASQEGRVLIMTTNHIEKLDKALIRPGRVDMKVHFGRADTAMTAAIFRAIYAPLEGDGEPSKAAAAAATVAKGGGVAVAGAQDPAEEEKRLAEEAKGRDEAAAGVVVLAEEFAAKIPAHEFSPAELQGFLMTHKRDPTAAVAGAEEWVVAARKEKQQKELEEAERRRKEEEEVRAAEQTKKEEEAKEEAAKKEKEERARKRKESRRRRKASRKSRRRDRDGSSSDSSDSSDESDDGKTVESKKKPAADAAAEELVAVEVNGEKKAPTADVKAGDSGYET